MKTAIMFFNPIMLASLSFVEFDDTVVVVADPEVVSNEVVSNEVVANEVVVADEVVVVNPE